MPIFCRAEFERINLISRFAPSRFTPTEYGYASKFSVPFVAKTNLKTSLSVAVVIIPDVENNRLVTVTKADFLFGEQLL